MVQPFVYGRPVRKEEFIGRESELRTIFNRIYNCESTAVIGDPHIGKSSLLLKVADPQAQQHYLDSNAKNFIFHYFDLLPIESNFSHESFWQEALKPFIDHPGNSRISRLLKQAETKHFDRRSLEAFFRALSNQEDHLVLLLDEFDNLVKHPNFKSHEFYALLRSLASLSGSLIVVTSSRKTISELNALGKVMLETGSPLFNYLIELNLKAFTDQATEILLAKGSEYFNEHDKAFIKRVTGRHPFLLQAMAAALCEIKEADRHGRAADSFYERISFHFDDLWQMLDDNCRTTAVILSLVELGGMAYGKEYAFGEIENVDAFGLELRKLENRGLAEQVSNGWQFDTSTLLLWRGERWTTASQAFTWWVRDVVIAGEHKKPTYDVWLQNKGYRGLLTNEQWNGLVRGVNSAPGWMKRTAGVLGKMLFDQLSKGA